MRSRRPAALIIATLLVLVLLPVAPAAAAVYEVSLDVRRIAGPDRYATAVAVARAGWPGWAGIDRVIVASGENRAFSDPMTAASLCWAYDAPLLLVNSAGVPASVRTALAEIRAVNTTVTITVVGGPVAVPGTTIGQLRSIVGANRVEQPWVSGDRFTMAAGIAARARQVAVEESRTVPARALIANGTNAAGFVDAMALSAVSARTGIPILLTTRDSVPPATAARLRSLPAGDVVVAGGPAVVSNAVYTAVGGTARWAGADRYGTAIAIAQGARARGWLDGHGVGIASGLADCLTGSIVAGRENSPVLLTVPPRLPEFDAAYLQSVASEVTSATIFGGTTVVSAAQQSELSGIPSKPVFVMPPPGGYVAKQTRVIVSTGVNTTEIGFYRGASLVETRTCGSYATVDFGTVATPTGGVTYRVIALGPDGRTNETAITTRLLAYPASTSIVVDKSDFRLYYVKNDVLIESYPVAIGRPSLETPTRLWKVGAKYHTDPGGVYGPRKLRLYMKSGSGWTATAYGIHGTNEPWVIGTKASHGCIRLYNTDILDLFPQVAIGTLVLTRE